MELNWLQSLIMGLFSGLTDILPVSSQAHQALLSRFFGETELYPLLRLVIHAAILVTVIVGCWPHLSRIRRQLRLLRQPRRRRSRTLDMAAVMDARILRTSLWPIIPALLLYGFTARLGASLLWTAAASAVNAVILYLPGLFPTADKDSRLVTPAESLLMGLGAGASVLPGISSVGASYSVGILHGVDRGYMIHLSLLMHMMVLFGLIIHDILDLLALGAVALSGSVLFCCGLAAAAAAAGSAVGLRILRSVAKRNGLTGFSFYSFGVALFAFILYLIV